MLPAPRRSKLDIILQYEPSWIGEAMSSLCLFLWACCMLVSDDYVWTDKAYLLPVACLIVSPIRGYGLMTFSSIMRAMAAVATALLWGVLAYTVFRRYGFIGSGGAYAGLMIGEIVNILKFSRRDYYFTKIEDSEPA